MSAPEKDPMLVFVEAQDTDVLRESLKGLDCDDELAVTVRGVLAARGHFDAGRIVIGSSFILDGSVMSTYTPGVTRRP